MPIRFRCAYCNQLMGIAHRKAGTVVHCPKCRGQVVVPTPQEEESPPPAPLGSPQMPARQRGQDEGSAYGGGVFERSDFGKVFEPGQGPQVLHQATLPPSALPPALPIPSAELSSMDF